MKLIKTQLPGVVLLEPTVFEDARGYFVETWSKRTFDKLGITCDFVQDNQAFSVHKHTLRGLHFQNGAAAQAKLVRCTSGLVLDVVVDIRKKSPTYLHWISVELSAQNHLQMFIPRGFAHGYLTLEDDVEFMYKADNLYAPLAEGIIAWNSPDIGINWGVSNPIVSEKDHNAPTLRDIEASLIFEE